MVSEYLFEYVAWFRDSSLPPDDEDYEWPGVVYIFAATMDAAIAWGDHLAETCVDEFLHSTAEPQLDPVPPEGVFARDGEELTAQEIGW